MAELEVLADGREVELSAAYVKKQARLLVAEAAAAELGEVQTRLPADWKSCSSKAALTEVSEVQTRLPADWKGCSSKAALTKVSHRH